MRKFLSTLLFTVTLLVGVGGFYFASFDVALAQGQKISDIHKPQDIGRVMSGAEEGKLEWMIGWALRPFAWAFQAVASLIMGLGSFILTKSIELSINSDILRNTAGIQVGWQVMRDFANLFFIFVILYIAIQTILQMGGHGMKEALVRVIVVALLINFSMFFTRVIIDVGNVLGVQFYNLIVQSDGPNNPGSSACTNRDGQSTCSIGDRFGSILGIQDTANADANAVQGELAKSMVYFFNGIVYLVLGIMLLKGAFYFIARTVVFIFLIVLSPVAFLAYAVPGSRTSEFVHGWWKKLLSYSLFAPIYLIIVYLVLQVAQGFPDVGRFDFINYLIIIGLVYKGSSLAFSFADETGHTIAKWGTGTTMGLATMGAGVVGRNTVGRASRMLRDSKFIDEASKKGGWKGFLAYKTKGMADKGAKSSFDVSESKYGAKVLGKAGADSMPEWTKRGKGGIQAKGGIETVGGFVAFGKSGVGEERIEKAVEQADKLYKKNPAAREAFLKQKLGYIVSSDGSKGMIDSVYKSEDVKNDKLTEAKKKIVSDKSKKQAEKTIADNVEALKTVTDIDQRNKLQQGIRNSLQEIGPKLVAELDEKVLPEIAPYLTSAYLQAVHDAYKNDKYKDENLLKTMGERIMTHTFDEKSPEAERLEHTREYLGKLETQEKLFGYAIPEDAKTQTRKYQASLRNTRTILAHSTSELAEVERVMATMAGAQDAELRHIAEDLHQAQEELLQMQEENGVGDDAVWEKEDQKRARDLFTRMRAKRREAEIYIEKRNPSQPQSDKQERIDALQKEYTDLQRSTDYNDIQRRNAISEELSNLQNE